MTVTTANCPSCGAPIAFKVGSSIVVICEFCNSAVARTDRDVRDLGKVADLIDTQSPLAVGVEGTFEGRRFVLTGRAQNAHSAGGVWDEWYATFGDGRTGWLAEAQGRFYMTFPQAVPPGSQLPSLHGLKPGMHGPLPGASGDFVVNEIGAGRPVAAEGEIPYELVPGQEFWFADLSGAGGSFATVDYSDATPALYAGREVTLADLGVRAQRDTFGERERHVGAARLTCPNCGGPMDLRVPDTERATCPNCNALLDVNQGNLKYLLTLQYRGTPIVPLGTEVTFDEGRQMLVGYMTRYCVVDGTTYPWDEYLLYSAELGFRWLVHDTGHWSYVVPISPGEVFDGEIVATYHNRQFKQFQAVTAYVSSVYGEFYWRVAEGETVYAKDYVNAPEILSKEMTSSEVAWSHGTYMSREQVAGIFGVSPDTLTAPSTIGMAQPNPHVNRWKPWAALVLIGLIVGLVALMTGARRPVFSKDYVLPALDSATGTQVVFADAIDLQNYQNIRVKMSAPVDNTWAYVEGDFVSEETGLVQNFSVPIEYYHGVEDGESWSEGSVETTTFLSALPTGRYTLRLEAQWERWQQPLSVSVEVEQGVPRVLYFLVLMGILLGGLALALLVRSSFEKRRWAESMFTVVDDSGDDSD